MTKIQKIEIKEVYVPKIRLWEVQPPILDIIYKPVVDIPGCVDAHRNNLTGLINEDELGTYQACGTFNIPSFVPLDYTPENMVITEEVPVNNEPPPLPETEQPKIPDLPKPPPPDFAPCPGKNEQRVGDFRNDKRFERVIGHERSEDGSKCITLYEDVTFIEQYIPGPAQLISTAAIATVAATTPLLLNIVKPLVKNVIKKLTKKKNNKK